MAVIKSLRIGYVMYVRTVATMVTKRPGNGDGWRSNPGPGWTVNNRLLRADPCRAASELVPAWRREQAGYRAGPGELRSGTLPDARRES